MTGHDGPAWEHGVRWGGSRQLLTCTACTHRHVRRVWIDERPRTKTRFNGRPGGQRSCEPKPSRMVRMTRACFRILLDSTKAWWWNGMQCERLVCLMVTTSLLIITIRPGGCEQAGVREMWFILFHLYLLFFSYWAAGPHCRDNKILSYLIVESVIIFTLWTART